MKLFEKMTRGERLSKKKEDEENLVNVKTISGTPDRKSLPVKEAFLEKGQKYNTLEADGEMLANEEIRGSFQERAKENSPETNNFVSVEEVIDPDSENEKIIEEKDEAIVDAWKSELKDIFKKVLNDGNDPYAMEEVLDELVENVNKEEGKSETEKRRDSDNLNKKIRAFLVAYKEILDKSLESGEEDEMIKNDFKENVAVVKAFKENIGDFVYFDGKRELINEDTRLIKKAKRVKGDKIEYIKQGKRSAPMMKAQKFKVGGGIVELSDGEDKRIRAYNPRTGKKEIA